MLFALRKSNEKQKVQIKTTAPGDENYQSVLVSTNWQFGRQFGILHRTKDSNSW